MATLDQPHEREAGPKPAAPPAGGATTTPDALRPGAPGASAVPGRASARGGFFSTTFESLSVPQYRMLWFGTLLGMGSMQMQMISRTILVDDLTGRAFITSIVNLGFAPSMLLLAMFGGVAGDRMEKRGLIQMTQFLAAGMAAVIGVLILTDAIIWEYLLVASILQGGIFAFQMPARQAIIPKLVGKEQITNAIALSAGGMSMMAVAAPAFAGYVYAAFGPEFVYFIVSGMYVMAVIMTGRIQKVPPEGPGKATRVLNQVGEGFGYVKSNRIVLLLIASGLTIAILAMPFRLQFPVFARRLYGDLNLESGLYEFDAGLIGLMLAVAGVGGIVGTLVVANLRQGSRRGLIVLAGSTLSGVAIVLVASLPWLAAGIAIMLLVGIAESTRMTLGQSLSLENTDAAFRARVSSIYMMTFGLMPLGALPLGYAVDQFGARESLLVAGLLVVVAGTLFLAGAKTLRRLS